MTQGRKHQGFTLVELMFAMSFISILLLSIALIAIQAGKTYNHGLVLRSVNHAGRDIGDILRRDFLQADQQQVSQSEEGNASVISFRSGDKYIGGRFCLGNISYIWNSPEVLDAEADSMISSNEYISRFTSNGVDEVINFVRVSDVGGAMCKEQDDGKYITQLDDDQFEVTNLLKRQSDEGEVVIGLHSLDVRPVDRANERSDGLFQIAYTLGTSRLSEIKTADQSCKPPIEEDLPVEESNLEFCAINQFNIIVRTNG